MRARQNGGTQTDRWSLELQPCMLHRVHRMRASPAAGGCTISDGSSSAVPTALADRLAACAGGAPNCPSSDACARHDGIRRLTPCVAATQPC